MRKLIAGRRGEKEEVGKEGKKRQTGADDPLSIGRSLHSITRLWEIEGLYERELGVDHG